MDVAYEFGDYIQRHENAGTTMAWCFVIMVYVFPVISAVLLPIYIWMNNVNKSRDQKVSIFTTTDILYKFTTIVLLVMISSIPTTIIALIIASFTWEKLAKYTMIICYLLYYLLRENVTMAINIIISVLAFSKFVFACNPSWIGPKASRKATRRVLASIPILSLICCRTVQFLVKNSPQQFYLEEWVRGFLLYLHAFSILCCIPYLILLIITKKPIESKKPVVKYQRNQIIVFFFYKLLLFPIFIGYQGLVSEKKLGMVFIDIGTRKNLFDQLLFESDVTVFMIQLTYIITHRASLRVLFRRCLPNKYKLESKVRPTVMVQAAAGKV